MDALTALRNKRDTRSYRDDPIDDQVLDRVLDAARMAGSAKNRQPVRLVVITDHGYERLANVEQRLLVKD